jgi:hypothetical protein
MTTLPIVEELRAALPPIFAGPSMDERTGGAICWGTVQNKRSRKEIPPECFIRSGAGPTIVVRDAFLNWWATTLRDARHAPRISPQQPRAGRKRSARVTADAGEAAR